MKLILTEPISDLIKPDIVLKNDIHRVFGRSLSIRVVDSGSCNACEGEIAALTNPFYDLERFGLKIVASPKHADILLVTGCVTRNMLEPLLIAYDNVPAPKLVVTLGDCTQANSLFTGSYAVEGPVSKHLPVLHHIPGCPPEPKEILRHLVGLMREMNKDG